MNHDSIHKMFVVFFGSLNLLFKISGLWVNICLLVSDLLPEFEPFFRRENSIWKFKNNGCYGFLDKNQPERKKNSFLIEFSRRKKARIKKNLHAAAAAVDYFFYTPTA
jgi:hypothetical protein